MCAEQERSEVLPGASRRGVAYNYKFVFLMDLELEPFIGTPLDVWRGFILGNDAFEALTRGYLVRFQAIFCEAARSEYASGLPVVFRDQIVKDEWREYLQQKQFDHWRTWREPTRPSTDHAMTALDAVINGFEPAAVATHTPFPLGTPFNRSSIASTPVFDASAVQTPAAHANGNRSGSPSGSDASG